MSAGAVLEAVTYQFASNLVTTVKTWVTWDDERENEAKRLEIIEKSFDGLKNLNQQMLDTLGIHDQKLMRLEREWAQLSNELPSYNWGVTKAYNSILTKAEMLRRIIDSIEEDNELDLESLSSLLNIISLCNCEKSNTLIESIELYGNTIKFVFQAMERSSNTFVYEVDSIPHWLNLTNRPTQVVYDGDTHLIYNSSNSCMKALVGISGPAILYRCNTRNYQDKRLDKWKIIKSVERMEDITQNL